MKLSAEKLLLAAILVAVVVGVATVNRRLSAIAGVLELLGARVVVREELLGAELVDVRLRLSKVEAERRVEERARPR